MVYAFNPSTQEAESLSDVTVGSSVVEARSSFRDSPGRGEGHGSQLCRAARSGLCRSSVLAS